MPEYRETEKKDGRMINAKIQKKPRKNYQTQWAGQFGVAHELVRRGYLVAFTMGNAPAADLLCLSPTGVSFSVQVKSLSSKNYFICQNSLLEPKLDRFFVFVLVPPVASESSKPPEYFILKNEDFLRVVKEEKRLEEQREKKRGWQNKPFSPGVSYSILDRSGFRNAWNNLPQ